MMGSEHAREPKKKPTKHQIKKKNVNKCEMKKRKRKVDEENKRRKGACKMIH